MPEREKELILKGSPCTQNYFDRTLLTIKQARERGNELCPNYSACETGGIYCAFTAGKQVAAHVVNGSTLEKELADFAKVPFLGKEFWNSVNRREFSKYKGEAEMLAAVETAVRVVLLMDAFESVLLRCDKCQGVKLTETVYDSIHDGPFPLSGSGKTVRRDVLYCPECESVPQGGFLTEDPADAKEREFLRKLEGEKTERDTSEKENLDRLRRMGGLDE